jgi:hypothetical protein
MVISGDFSGKMVGKWSEIPTTRLKHVRRCFLFIFFSGWDFLERLVGDLLLRGFAGMQL